MSTKYSSKDDELNLNQLTLPVYVAHIKPGSTLCTNGECLIFQDGSTTIVIRTPPEFTPRKIPWREGLIRDIVWCPELHAFIFLTQKSLFTFDPDSRTTSDIQLKVTAYCKIKPLNDNHSFWRCTCVGLRVYISYSGFGSIIDEYLIGPGSCDLIKRWTPPKTCANHEGIWCIRYQPETHQIGLTIMNGRNNQWRFEVRSRTNLSIVWQTVLPITHGDCEVLSLVNEEWLAVNSCGVRLVQIAQQKFKAAVEYERELRNVITIGENYFVVRTKNTLEIHLLKRKER